MNLSNMSFASPSCLLHYYTLCKHCHLVVASAINNLFIYLIEGGGRNIVTHLDIMKWVVCALTLSL